MSIRLVFFVSTLLVLCGGTAVAAHADGTPDAPTFQDIRTAIPAASFQVPTLAQCCGQCGGKGCGAGCGCAKQDPCCKRLRFSINLVGWLTAMDGSTTIAGRDVDVDMDLGDVIDILDKVDSILQGSIRVDYGRWFARFSGSYLKLGDDIEVLVDPGRGVAVPGRVEIKQSYYQLVAGYNVKKCPGPRTGCCCSEFRLDVYAGARWADMSMGIILPAPQVEGGRDWVDPIVGAHVAWDLKNKWVFDVDADIGGFGVNSDLTWRLRMGAQYNFNRWFGLNAGWMFLDYDYSTGSGPNRFRWDVLTHGPYFGLSFRF